MKEGHLLPDCFLVWYAPFLRGSEDWMIEEICDQGYADFYYNGINKEDAKRVRKTQ